jgi:hypothetical protein
MALNSRRCWTTSPTLSSSTSTTRKCTPYRSSAHITATEWEQFGQGIFEKFTNSEKLIATGVLEDVATPEEVQWFVGELPLPIKLTWRFVGGGVATTVTWRESAVRKASGDVFAARLDSRRSREASGPLGEMADATNQSFETCLVWLATAQWAATFG